SFDASSYILSVIDLTRLLSAETLYFLSQGKKEGALNLLNAQISLAESVESRSIIDSIVLTSCYRNIYGCSKFFPYLDDDIVAKLSSFDPIKSTKEGFVFEAAESYSLFDAGYIEKSGKGAKFFPYFYSRPYLRLEHYEYLRFYLMGIKVVEKENPCELKDKEITENIIKEMPKWAIISKIAMPNWRDAWVRSYRLKIEKDLTLLALKAKEEKNKKGSFPESLSLNETICPNTSYKYIKNGDKIKIFFDGNFKADEKSAFVPLSWEE
ncbi:MAG: hypothetical protein N2445_06320, partial [Acidobacteria bacterium]|nr:hypothetical protein [Acidobacteriota bacterium]